jgi:predicted ATPase
MYIAQASGVPLLVQALFEQGVLARNGTVKVVKPLALVQISPTVRGILGARIDRLAPAEKELLQTLAVIGKEFPLGLVWRVTDRSEDELTPELAKLQFREFIYEKPTFPQSEYTFKHSLTHEVAHQSVLIERRRQIHERTATALKRAVRRATRRSSR